MCKIQNKDGEWIDAVIYIEEGGNMLFVKEENEFNLKFKVVEE